MSIENINDLEAAEIRVNEETGELEDTYLAIYKDDTMNFTRFENLPIPIKHNIDKRIENFEKEMTLKMQDQNIINKIYTKDEETGEIVETYLKLDEIAEKLNNVVYKEIGVRYDISAITGEHTSPNGRNVIRNGNTILIAGADLEPSLLSPSFSTLDINGNEVLKENIFARDYYPWNNMRKVQINIDDNINYFTEVPLYYIDQRYILEEPYYEIGYDGNTCTRYKQIMDITGVWNSDNPVESIPEEYRNDNYSIGIYKWVCEYPLYGYRPASFFVRKVNKIPTIDDGTYNGSIKRYVKVEINNETYYVLYKNYLEGNLKTGEIPSLYCLEEIDNSGYNTKVLTSKHYFGCYEVSVFNRDNKYYASSRPNSVVYKNTRTEYRQNIKNIGSDYYMFDLQAKTDFFEHLMDIEFSTLNSQSVCAGYSDGLYIDNDHNIKIPFDHNTSTKNSFICTYALVSKLGVGQTISGGPWSGAPSSFNKAIIKSMTILLKDTDFTINENTTYYRTNTDSVPTYSTNVEESKNGKIYYLANIPIIGNEIYVAVIESESNLPKSQTLNNKIYEIYYCKANKGLYIPNNNPINGRLYKITIDKNIVTSQTPGMPKDTIVYSDTFLTGSTDKLSARNGTIATSVTDGKFPFRWNWIENPYGSMSKCIDGCHISYDETNNYNIISYSDVPELWNDVPRYPEQWDITEAYTKYTDLKGYTIPYGSGYCGQLGFDLEVPWIQLLSKFKDSIYSDYVVQNKSQTNDRFLLAGGSLKDGLRCGIRYYSITEQIGNRNPEHSTYIQKYGE